MSGLCLSWSFIGEGGGGGGGGGGAVPLYDTSKQKVSDQGKKAFGEFHSHIIC